MAGFANDVVYANNGDFSIAGSNKGQLANGLLINGQMWIGSTALNVGGTHINVGTITSPLGTITIGYASPNITIDLTGGGKAIDSIAMQTGTSPVTPDGAGLLTFNGAVVVAGTNPVRTDGTGANTMALEVQISQAIAATDATKIGLSNFDSSVFTVDANGFVSTAGGGGFTWSDASGSFNAAKNHGYFITNTSTATLPAAPSQGDTIIFTVDTTNILTITANTGQVIRIGAAVSAAAGTAANSARGDSVTLVYRSTGTAWIADSVIGAAWIVT